MTTVDAAPRRGLIVTAQVRATISQLAESGRRVAILLDWPAAAAFESADEFQPAPCDVIVAHVDGCPVYVDLRQRNAAPAGSVYLDVDPSSGNLCLRGPTVRLA